MPTKDIRVHLSQNQMGSFYIGLLNLHWARKCLSDTKVEDDNLKESQFTMKTKDSMGKCSITIYTGS